MLTERGWASAGAGLALVILWVLFGEIELGLAGFLLMGGVVVALWFVAANRPRLSVARRIAPGVVHEGDHASVTLVLGNGGSSVRHLTLNDEVAGLGTAEFSVASIGRGAQLTATYRILCRPRGVYPIGPAGLSVSDPFGLAGVTATAGPVDPLTVYPAVEELSGYPAIRGRSVALNALRPDHSQAGGEDFYTMREYQRGDDLRRVHWPSSAHRDQLMIRQMETPWQARAMVLLDIRAEAYESEASFEHAVRGAASVVRHLAQAGFAADVMTGFTSTDAAHYAATMEALAIVQAVVRFDLDSVAARLRRAGGGGALVLVTGNPDTDLLGVHRMLSGTYPTTILLASTSQPSTTLRLFERVGVTPVVSQPDASWSPAWSQAMDSMWHTVSAG